MARDYVFEATFEGESDLRADIRAEMVAKLAAEWNEAHRRIEERSFRDQDERDNEADYLACRCEDEVYQAIQAAVEAGELPDEAGDWSPRGRHHAPIDPAVLTAIEAVAAAAETAFYAEHDKRRLLDHERLRVAEELLGELGARMARPYEHWNEEERYMEYMENRYDNDY